MIARCQMNRSAPERNIRLLLFDLDGTLLDSGKRILQRNLAAIAECRRKGIMIGVATARSESTCARFVREIEPDLLISNSGALVRLRGKIIYECGFNAAETSAIINAGVAEHRGITADCADVTYTNRYIEFFHESGMEYTDFSGFSRSCFKICIEGTDAEFADRTAALVEDCSWLAFSDCDWFKFSKGGVSKGDALRHVVSSTGIPAENMAAFGDDFVDIEMLDLCGVGIVMSNAVDEVKKHADVVIDDNDSDAIAEYLHLHVL